MMSRFEFIISANFDMQTKVTYDTTEFDKALKEFKTESSDMLGLLFHWQMALWVHDLIKKTATDPTVKNANTQQAMGEKAIAKDLRSLFADPMMKAHWTDKTGAYEWIRLSEGGRYQIPSAQFMPQASFEEYGQVHQANRNSRGRVTDRSDDLKTKYHMQHGNLSYYIQQVQKGVGKTKAGWLKAADYFDAKALGEVKDVIPDWVQRHAGEAASWGTFFDNLNTEQMVGKISSSNNVPWLKDRDGILQATAETRVKDLKKWAVLRWQKIADKHATKAKAVA